MTTGATLNRGGSRQDYQTDPLFIDAVRERFGNLDWDLAADSDNRQAPQFLSVEDNSLACDWTTLEGRNLWLNPPFKANAKWARKCIITMEALRAKRPMPSTKILLLTPASVGSNWFWDYVGNRALVLCLSPRLTFVGAKHNYPKDLMLSVYGVTPGFERWRWC